MIRYVCDDYILLFQETRHIISFDQSLSNVIYDDRIIIDDIQYFYYHILTILYYFFCTAQVFTKYGMSFKLSKCQNFKRRMKYGVHDLTAD